MVQTIKPLNEGRDIVDEYKMERLQLSAIGCKTSELKYVFLTHMDIDHASGVKTCSGRKKYNGMERRAKSGKQQAASI